LPLAEGWKSTNVENLKEDKTSILNLYKRLLSVRRNSAALAHGSYAPYLGESDLLIYFREFEDQRALIVLNLTHIESAIAFPVGQIEGSVLVSIFGDRDGEPVADTIVLRGDEGLVIGLSRVSKASAVG
jgi:alpha-glucosidase